MNEENKREEEQKYAGLTAALADVSGAPTLGDHSVAPAGAAVAMDEQAAPLFRPPRRKSFALAGMQFRGALWMNPAARWSRRIVWWRRR